VRILKFLRKKEDKGKALARRMASVGLCGGLVASAFTVATAPAALAAGALDVCGGISYTGAYSFSMESSIELRYSCTEPVTGADGVVSYPAPKDMVLSYGDTSRPLAESDWTLQENSSGQPARGYVASVPVSCMGPTTLIKLKGPGADYEREVAASDIVLDQQPGCAWPATAVANPVIEFDAASGRVSIDTTGSTVTGRYILFFDGQKTASGISLAPGMVHTRELGKNLSGKDLRFTLEVTSQLLDATNDSRKRFVWPADPSTVAPASFSDVQAGDQFASEIAWMAKQGISKGWAEADGSTAYRPLQPVNRDAMAAFMYRLGGNPVHISPAESPFADVATDQQFYSEMTWLATRQISTGWTEPNGTKTYRALQSVNRDAMAAFLYRLAGSPTYTPPAQSPFADISTQQQFYKEMAWLAEKGISTGWLEPDGSKTYRALQPVNRDAMAAFMYRFFNVT
jgi:S-layer homology domain